MPSIMLYSLVVAALVGAAALMAERALAELRLARRFVWLIALVLSLALPAYSVLLRTGTDTASIEPPREASPEPGASAGPSARAEATASLAIEVDAPLYAWPAWLVSGLPLGVVWIASSAAVGALFAASWLALRRELARAHARRLDGVEVAVLDGYGPAVLGFLRPRIVLPRWLLDADRALQRIVLRHELEHIAARDQLVLLAGLVLVAAAPWNVPLWWQLRRLRAAIEIDCDARVLQGAMSENAYADALLEVQQRRGRAPIAAVALSERPTHLERRIRIMLSPRDRRVHRVIGTSALGAVLSLLAACAVNAPATDSLIKAPPSGLGAARPLLDAAGRIVLERYGGELRGGDPRPARVELVFDETGTLVRSTLERRDEPAVPAPPLQGGPTYRFLVCLEVLEGAARCPTDAERSQRLVAVEIHDPARMLEASGRRDTEDIDRRIAERYFADVFSTPPPGNSGYWVLLDSGGRVLAAGREPLETPFSDAGAPLRQIQAALKRRYPDAEIERATIAPLRDRASRTVADHAGKSVRLYSAWLSADSPPPR